MRKFLLTTALVFALAVPAEAQCITQDMLKATAAGHSAPLFYTLRDIRLDDIKDRVDVLIFEVDEEHYFAFALLDGCLVDQAGFDQTGVEEFINHYTKRADDPA